MKQGWQVFPTNGKKTQKKKTGKNWKGNNSGGKNVKIASQMPKPHSLQALQKHHEIVPLGSQNIKSVAMAILVRRLKLKVNKL